MPDSQNPNHEQHHGSRPNQGRGRPHFPNRPAPTRPVESCLNERASFYVTEDGTERSDKLMAKVIHNLKLLMNWAEDLNATIGTFQQLILKDQPNGYAGLNSDGQIDLCRLPIDELDIPDKHNDLEDRDVPKCHPVSAIEGLTEIIQGNSAAMNAVQNALKNFQLKAEKDVIGGYVGLNVFGKINETYLPDYEIPSNTNDLVTSRSWTVKGLDVGGWKVGMEVPEGMTLTELLTVLFTSAFPPSYVAPGVIISFQAYAELDGTNQTPVDPPYEIGTPFWCVLTVEFEQNDAGGLGGGHQALLDNELFSELTMTGTTVTASRGLTLFDLSPHFLQARLNYMEGPVKPDSEGELSPDGHIPAGSATSNIITLQGVHMWYLGSQELDPANRTLTESLIKSYPKATPYDTSQPFQATCLPRFNQILIAYPASLPDLSGIYYEGGVAACEYLDLFRKEIHHVTNGVTGTDYKCYVWNLDASALGDMVFTVTFGNE
jgi:hypothetical protein